MKRENKKFIEQGVVVPVIIAIALAVVFFLLMGIIEKDFPTYDKNIAVSPYSTQELKTIENISCPEGIRRSKLPVLEGGNVIGSAKISSAEMEIVFDGNDVNSSGRLSMPTESVLFGEAGSVYLFCSKANADTVKALKQNDLINISTFYGKGSDGGKYSYRVVAVENANTEQEAFKLDDGIGRSLVIYTDAHNGVGISNSYFAVVCKMVSGDEVTQ